MKKQRARIHQVYQRAKANEMAMRYLLPNEAAIQRPSFFVGNHSPSSVSPTSHVSVVLPPLSHLLDNSSTEDSRTAVSHAMKKRNLQGCSDSSNQLRKSPQQGKILSHPLAINVSTPKGHVLTSAGMNSAAKLVRVPLTMSDLLETTPIKVI